MWLGGRVCDKHLECQDSFKKTYPKPAAEIRACSHSAEEDEAGGWHAFGQPELLY